jgi:hypothetical protein
VPGASPQSQSDKKLGLLPYFSVHKPSTAWHNPALLIVSAWDGAMEFSKLQLDLYDIFGLIVPGLLVICEFWIAMRGWGQFVVGVAMLSATGMTILLLASFAVGPIVQEITDGLTRLRKERFSRHRRDEIWSSEVGEKICEKLHLELNLKTGTKAHDADLAFDVCFALVPEQANRHDLFLAQSRSVSSTIGIGARNALCQLFCCGTGRSHN